MSVRGDLISADDPFAASVAELATGTHLGDSSVVEGLLRELVSDAFEDDADIDDLLDTFAGRLLGESDDYTPVPGWNREGSIDVFLAPWVSTREASPTGVLKHFGVRFLDEIADVAAYAAAGGDAEDDWRWQIDSLVEHYTGLLMGVAPTVDRGAVIPPVDPKDAMRESIRRLTEGWVTINQDEDGEGGQPILIEDGKIKSGKFAGETMKGAFGKGGKADELAAEKKSKPDSPAPAAKAPKSAPDDSAPKVAPAISGSEAADAVRSVADDDAHGKMAALYRKNGTDNPSVDSALKSKGATDDDIARAKKLSKIDASNPTIKRLEQGGHPTLLASVDDNEGWQLTTGNAQGYMALRPSSDGNLEVHKVEVHGDFQRLGLAEKLYAAADADARAQGKLLKVSNEVSPAAKALHNKLRKEGKLVGDTFDFTGAKAAPAPAASPATEPAKPAPAEKQKAPAPAAPPVVADAGKYKSFAGHNDAYVASLADEPDYRITHMMNADDPAAAAADIKSKFPGVASKVDKELEKAIKVKAVMSGAKTAKPKAAPQASKTAAAAPAVKMHPSIAGDGPLTKAQTDAFQAARDDLVNIDNEDYVTNQIQAKPGEKPTKSDTKVLSAYMLGSWGADPAKYELTTAKASDVIPSQAGEAYINPSSKGLAKHIGKFMSSGRAEDYAPIMVDPSGVIIDGNHRHAARGMAGITDVPVLRPKPGTYPPAEAVPVRTDPGKDKFHAYIASHTIDTAVAGGPEKISELMDRAHPDDRAALAAKFAVRGVKIPSFKTGS